MPGSSRVLAPSLRSRIMSAEQAAALIPSGVNVGMSGFTGAGYPKVVPHALARRIMDAKLAGENFRIGVWTGASTAPELDGTACRFRHRAGPRRPARAVAQATREDHHRQLRAPGLPTRAPRLLPANPGPFAGQAHAPPAGRGVLLASQLPADRPNAPELILRRWRGTDPPVRHAYVVVAAR